MDQDRWQVINRIFHAALDLPVNQRRSYVVTATGDDPMLRKEIEELLDADEKAGSYLESPLLANQLPVLFEPTSPPIKSGNLLCNRFLIGRTLGEGGMGHVFEAFDNDLGVVVALKVIRPEIASSRDALARFRQEVRLARRITHLNVCRTYDLNRDIVADQQGNAVELVFLTMEFLSGETLDARIRQQGAMPSEDALAVARQLVSALAAAHAMGIVHRDIKPANVMLVMELGPSDPLSRSSRLGDAVKPSRAVITDFGLARAERTLAVSDLPSIGTSQGPIGTLAYMAPEQLRGAATSPATDIYALGLVLFEMVTGQRAFSLSNPLADLANRLTGAPPNPTSIRPGIPETWRYAIEGCLRVDSSLRFQQVEQVLATLEGEQGAPPATCLVRLSAQHRNFSSKLIWAMAAVLLLTVSLLIALFRLYEHRAAASIAPGALIYVVHVKNETKEKMLDNLTELINAGLTQSPQLTLLDESRVGDIMQQMTRPAGIAITEPIAHEIALRTGAARVVFLTVTESAGSYTLHVDIQQPDSSVLTRYRHHWTNNFFWRSKGSPPLSAIPQELLTAVRDTTNWIRQQAGESSNDIATLDLPPEDVTTGSWQALRDYAESQRLSRINQLESASVALRRAIKEDPDFALAYGRLGDVLLSLNRDSEGYRMYDIALDKSQFSRLTRKEEDRIRGMRAVDTADYQAAIDAFHDFTIYYKNDYLGWVYQTLPLRMLGRDAEASSNLRRAIALDPSQSYAPLALVQELMILGKLDEIPQWIQHLEKFGHQEDANDARGCLLLLQGRYDEASQIFQKFTTSPSPGQRFYGYIGLAHVAAERNRFPDAVDFLNRGLAESDAQSDLAERAAALIDRGYVECAINRFDMCLQDVRKGFALSPTPKLALAVEIVLGRASAGTTARKKTEILEALKAIDRSIESHSDGTISEIVKLRYRGELHLAEGHTAEAVADFEKAAAKDAPASQQEYLGRALTALASTPLSPDEKQRTLDHATQAYRVVSQAPALVFSDLSDYPPGFYADQLDHFNRLTALSASQHNPGSNTADIR